MIQKIWKIYKALPIQARASSWFLVCNFAQKAISTLTTPIFTRLLTPEEYGQFNVFNSWYGILSVFIMLRISYGMFTQGLVKYSKQRNRYISSMQGMALTLTVFWTTVYLLFHSFWNRLLGLTTVQMLAMLVMIWASSVADFWSTEQRVEYCYRSLVIITLLVAIAKPAVGIFLVKHAQDKVTARILGLALVELVAYVGLFVGQMRRGKVFFDAGFWTRALRLNLPLIPHYLSQSVLNGADRIMIKNMVGEREAGIYGLAYSISLVMVMFNSALMQTMGPWIFQKIKAHQENDIENVSYFGLLIVAAVNLLLIAMAPEVVAVFAPFTYQEAIWVIPPVAMSTIFTFSYDLFSNFAFYYEKTKFIACASIIGAFLNVFLNAVFIPVFGYYAAGYTTLICYIAYASAHYFCMRRICREYGHNANYCDWKILLSVYGGFMCCGFLFEAAYIYPFIRYSIIAGTSIMAFFYRKNIYELLRKIAALNNY